MITFDEWADKQGYSQQYRDDIEYVWDAALAEKAKDKQPWGIQRSTCRKCGTPLDSPLGNRPLCGLCST